MPIAKHEFIVFYASYREKCVTVHLAGNTYVDICKGETADILSHARDTLREAYYAGGWHNVLVTMHLLGLTPTPMFTDFYKRQSPAKRHR